MRKVLLFTDLDGTLIDHHTYSPSVAKKALKILVEKDVPVIFCSSKTFAEQVHLQKKLSINHPFIIENGSAIAIPKGYFPNLPENVVQISGSHDLIVLARKNAADIKRALSRINEDFKLNLFGYSQSNNKTIFAMTGLKGKAVQRAKDRRFTESLFSEQPSLEALKMFDSFGLCALRGGRFLTIQDKEVDKGKAVQQVANFFQYIWGLKPLTIGIGDTFNDESFLKVVDRPFLVQKHDGTWADVETDNLVRIKAIGPKGFWELTKNMLE